MRFAVVTLVAAALAAACGSGENRTSFTVSGRVQAGQDDAAGVAGVRVSCPAAPAETLTAADGSFTLNASVPTPPDGTTPRVAVWFEKDGLASVPKSFLAVEGVAYTALAIMAEVTHPETVNVPTGTLQVTVPSGPGIHALAKFTLFEDSLEDATGAAVEGAVDTVSANWDPTNPDRWLLIPVFPAVAGSRAYLRSLAIGQFSASQGGKPLALGGSQGVGITMTTYLPPQPDIQDTDDRLFHVDPATGELVEKTSAELNAATRTLKASIDDDGTWVWAREFADTSCVSIEVTGPEGTPVVGAQVALLERAVSGTDLELLDETIGAPGGAYCLRGPVGKLGRVRVWLARGGRLIEDASAVSLTAAGSCATKCEAQVSFTLACEGDADCLDGRKCQDGACLMPK